MALSLCVTCHGDARSRAVSGGDTVKYRYDQGWSVLNEETGGGTLQATYVHSPMRPIGTVLATSAGSTASSGTWNYYFQDAIGSTRGLWDQDALRLGKYEYTPFGGKYSEHGEDITRKFTGHDWDADARLYYTAYRYYSPDANRWLTRDPLGMVDGPNVYVYVVNNPVALWDADGRFFGLGSLVSGSRLTGQLYAGSASAAWIVYAYIGVLTACLMSSFVGGLEGPQGNQTQHCVVGCKLKKCAGYLIGSGESVLWVMNHGWEIIQAQAARWFRDPTASANDPEALADDEAAVFGATVCDDDCESCEDCCSRYYPAHAHS